MPMCLKKKNDVNVIPALTLPELELMHWRECEETFQPVRISAISATSTVCAVHGAEQAGYWNTDSPDAEKSKSQAAICFSQQ